MPDKNLILMGKIKRQRENGCILLILEKRKSKCGKNGWWVLCCVVSESRTRTSWKGSLVCNEGKRRQRERRNSKGKANLEMACEGKHNSMVPSFKICTGFFPFTQIGQFSEDIRGSLDLVLSSSVGLRLTLSPYSLSSLYFTFLPYSLQFYFFF